MIPETNNVVVADVSTPTEKQNSITNITERGDDILLLAEEAEKKVTALKKVMTACLMITNANDWVLIGGKPYLQESGCTKVANLIGVSFEIAPGFPQIETDKDGYKTFTYRVRAFGKNTYVEGEGQRTMRDEFFGKNKKPEQIDERDVRLAALTNAKANAIKSIIPGLKNVEVSTLKDAGINLERVNAYDFNTGKNGGKTGQETDFECESCRTKISGKVASYSKAQFSGHVYCMNCQKKAAATKERLTGVKTEPYDPNQESEE